MLRCLSGGFLSLPFRSQKPHWSVSGNGRHAESKGQAAAGFATQVAAILVQELSENLYQNTAQMVHFISERFGKKYTCQGVVPLLHRLGFSYKKTKLVPCQADLSQQVAFVDTLNTLKASLESDSAVLYFADAVHPQHNTRSSYAWIPKGEEKELPSVSGRQRLNCNGAINPFEVRDMEVRFDTCINAQSTWLLYKQLEEKHSDKACIYVVCDNARYYKNKWLQEQLQGSKINQIFLPAYSPNLNLIERLWKFMRKKVIDTHFYRTFEEFRQKILAFFEHIEQYKQELETLFLGIFIFPRRKPLFIEYKDCTMEGGVDFYCPRGWAYAENCRFICHSKNAAIWHDSSQSQDCKTVLKNCTFEGDNGFKLGRYHKEAQFYLLNCTFAKNMADAAIYWVATASTPILWGERVYYYNCHRKGGDFEWHKNNLKHVNPKKINVDWVFGKRWRIR